MSIAGPSGCGKSTLLAILGLLDTPTEGVYYLNGKPVTGLKLSERARIRNREIGFIFQAFNLIGDLTVYENVELPLTYRGMPSADRKRRVQEALERVGMSHRMKHFPAQLSGGQQQRVAVARALAGEPLILLADEPTGNLDSANGEAVMDAAPRVARGGFHHLHGDARSPIFALRGPDHPPLRRPDRGRKRGAGGPELLRTRDSVRARIAEPRMLPDRRGPLQEPKPTQLRPCLFATDPPVLRTRSQRSVHAISNTQAAANASTVSENVRSLESIACN